MADHEGNLPTAEDLLNVRNAKTDEEWEVFVWYHDVLVPLVAGKRWWDEDRRHYNILQCQEEIDGEKNKNPIPASTEAFVVLCFESNAKKWPFMHEFCKTSMEKFPSAKANDNMKALYIEPNSGKKKFGGWNPKGIKRFEEIRQQIIAEREKEAENGFKQEKECLARVRTKNKVQFATAQEAATAKSKGVVTLDAEAIVIVEDEAQQYDSSDEESGKDDDGEDSDDETEDEEDDK